MNEPQPVAVADLFAGLPRPWPEDGLRAQIAEERRRSGRLVVVLDDDPTGTQTVHEVPVLTRWEVADVRAAIADQPSALYLLTNSRSLPLAQAVERSRQATQAVLAALPIKDLSTTFVSRSDSTLRGHFPEEVDAVSQALAAWDGQPVDAVLLAPCFPEGGRFTVGDVHWVQEGEVAVPAAQTPYARDVTFGYVHSHLAAWVEEKSDGAIQARTVQSLSLEQIRTGGPEQVMESLCEARGGAVVVVNAACDRDLEVIALAVTRLETRGRRFLLRSSASFVKVLAGIPERPLLSSLVVLAGRTAGGGLIVVGSHVPKTTRQLEAAFQLDDLDCIELAVADVLDPLRRERAIAECARFLDRALARGHDALLFTSRSVRQAHTPADSLRLAAEVASALTAAVRRLTHPPRYILGKGGITSSDLATDALGARSARVLGQILPGVPVWRLGPGSRWPETPLIIFPGNVGGDEALAQVITSLRQPQPAAIT